MRQPLPPDRRAALRDKAFTVGTLTAALTALLLLPVAFAAAVGSAWGWLVFVVGGICGQGLLMGGGWYLVFSRFRCTRGRAALLGGLVGIFSHYLVWLAIGVGGALARGDLTMMLATVLGALPLTFASIIVLGWLSIPVTALIGWTQGADWEN